MKHANYLLVSLLFCTAALMLNSCWPWDDDDDSKKVDPDPKQEEPQVPVDDEPTSIGSVTVNFSSSMTPDLLELVTPVVTYKDKGGEHTERLTKEVCELEKNEFKIRDSIYVSERYIWKPTLNFDMYLEKDFDETISLRFEQNDVAVDMERYYDLQSFFGVIEVKSGFTYEGERKNILASYTTVSININIGDGLSHDDGLYIGESVHKYVNELLKTKQDYHIEIDKAGTVKLNGK